MTAAGATAPGRRRVVAVALLVLACAAGATLVLLLGFITVIGCSSGDGGVPYVAEDSPKADVCAATADGLLLALAALALLAAAAIFAWRLLKAWTEARRAFLPALGPLLVVPLAPLLPFWIVNVAAPSTCSDEQEAAVDAWRAAGEEGDPPYDCEHY